MLDTLTRPAVPNTLAFISMPQGAEWLVIAALGLLMFGKRLPEVGKGMGQAIMQFKKGLKGVEDEIEASADAPEPAPRQIEAQAAAPALPNHKFDPYTGKPVEAEKPKFDPYTGKAIEERSEA